MWPHSPSAFSAIDYLVAWSVLQDRTFERLLICEWYLHPIGPVLTCFFPQSYIF